MFQVQLGTEVLCTPSWPNWGLNSWPPDHDSTLHVTESPALATWPSVPHINPYNPDSRFGEPAWWSRSPRKFNQLFLVSLQSYPQNFIPLRICCVSVGFPVGQSAWWTRIATKIKSILPFTTPDPSIKFHLNMFITFKAILLTDKQTNSTQNNLLATEVMIIDFTIDTAIAVAWHMSSRPLAF